MERRTMTFHGGIMDELEMSKKKYLLVIDEHDVGIFHAVMPMIKFIEVIGMNTTNDPNIKLLASPQPIESEVSISHEKKGKCIEE